MFLACGVCQWHSSGIGLTGTLDEIAKTLKDRNQSLDSRMSSLVELYQTQAKEEMRKLEASKQSSTQVTRLLSVIYELTALRADVLHPTTPFTSFMLRPHYPLGTIPETRSLL